MSENIPNHVAIILDGNGRWAKKKGMPRNYGHIQGAKNVEVICRAAYDMGIKYLTVYAFSTENWNRPQEEVDALMKLLNQYMKNCQKTAKKNKMRLIAVVLGEEESKVRNSEAMALLDYGFNNKKMTTIKSKGEVVEEITFDKGNKDEIQWNN